MFRNSSKRKNTFHTLASVIDNFVASFLVVFIYRNLEHQKIIGLKLHNGKFDTNLALNVDSTKKIYWWINIFESFAPLNIPDTDIIIYTDTSITG